MSEISEAQFLERSFDNFFSLVETNKLREPFAEFCGKLGYTAVSDYLMDASTYQIMVPTEAALDVATVNDKVAVIALPLGSSIEVTSTSHDFHSDARKERITSPVTTASESAIASIWAYPHVEFNDQMKTVVHTSSQPVFVANTSLHNLKSDLLCPTVIGHEIMHVAQVLVNPIQSFSAAGYERELAINRLNHEIEAYSYQSQLFDPLLFNIGRVTSIDMAGCVDSLRWAVSRDSYKTSPVFLERARKHEFIQRILPEVLLESPILT